MNTTPEFEIRSYGKSELAAHYLPGIDPQSALRTFYKWIERCPGLTEALQEAGFISSNRRYTPQQVRLIVDALGEP